MRSMLCKPEFERIAPYEAADLLAKEHYLGPIGRAVLAFGQWSDDELVGAQVWKLPTARYLPCDGSWLELARWCLTPSGGPNAGSRMHAFAVRQIRSLAPACTTLVSYSDPGAGHTGALYRACNWQWAPTWHRLSPPPTGNGSWGGGIPQGVKDRWIFEVRRDSKRSEIVQIRPYEKPV